MYIPKSSGIAINGFLTLDMKVRLIFKPTCLVREMSSALTIRLKQQFITHANHMVYLAYKINKFVEFLFHGNIISNLEIASIG